MSLLLKALKQVESPPPEPVPHPLKIRAEYHELRDHLLTRFPLQKHATLLFIDAGRMAHDAAWLAPFAVCLLEGLSESAPGGATSDDAPTRNLPKVLIVEAAGPGCGIASQQGLDGGPGISEVLHGKLSWKSAIQPTFHLQIQFLGRGASPLLADEQARLANLWSDLKLQFDLMLVAAGPLEVYCTAESSDHGSAAPMFLPLADAAILCVELDGTPQFVAARTKRELEQRGVNLVGCVVRGQPAAA